MGKDMSTYDPEAKCAACGHDLVGTRYVGPIEQDPCWYDRKYKPLGKWPEEAYLHRTCERCGNEWPEATMSPALSALLSALEAERQTP